MAIEFYHHSRISLISTPGVYLILKLYGVALIGRWYLKKGGTYFKVRKVIPMKFKLCNFLYPNNNK